MSGRPSSVLPAVGRRSCGRSVVGRSSVFSMAERQAEKAKKAKKHLITSKQKIPFKAQKRAMGRVFCMDPLTRNQMPRRAPGGGAVRWAAVGRRGGRRSVVGVVGGRSSVGVVFSRPLLVAPGVFGWAGVVAASLRGFWWAAAGWRCGVVGFLRAVVAGGRRGLARGGAVAWAGVGGRMVFEVRGSKKCRL